MPTPTASPSLIDQQDQLDRLCRNFADQQVVAVDTEFMRTDTYAPKLGLVQLHAAGTTALIDPLAPIDLKPLWQLLLSPERLCLLHSAKQDMEAIWFCLGKLPPALIDTQICAGLLGYPAQAGYATLAGELLQVSMGKSETRTDWTRRPLTTAQLHYAIEDVLYLPAMHSLLQARLEQCGRYGWALEDSAALTDERLYRPDPAVAWQRLKRISFLPPAEQARAKALASWRESRSVTTNRPRQWVLSDSALLELAARNPESNEALNQMRELPPAVARKQASELLTALATANATDPGQHQQRIPERGNTRLRKLLKVVQSLAKELDVAAEVLASKRDIEALLHGDPEARCTRGWRKGVIGDRLLSALQD